MLDSIIWGNPTQREIKYLNSESPLDKHIPNVINLEFPKNSSKATREELNTITDYINDLKADEAIYKRYRDYDVNLVKVFANIIIEQKLGDEAAQVIDQLFDDTLPFVLKLKYHFQRPRPYQLAAHYKLKLFPFYSTSSNTPSYPSGHALQANLICYVLGNMYPEKFNYFDNLAKDISYSRQYLGLHYPSDCDYSEYCTQIIIKDKDFKAKYKL